MKKILIALVCALCVSASLPQPVVAASSAPSSLQDRQKKKVETVTFRTTIHCKNCVKKIMDNIAFERGVKDLKVSLDEKLVTITYDSSKTDEAALVRALEKLGYKAEKVEAPVQP